ncbi:MAG: hypothetical protein ABI824_04750 [Acidobacteriota bacterium]
MDNDKIMFDLPWVKTALSAPFSASDVLFKPVTASPRNRDWRTNAKVADPEDWAYAEGYRLAGRILANYIIEGQRESYIVFPIVFQYRHCVELQFKHLIPNGAFLLDRALPEQDRKLLMTSHRLDQLWRILRPILKDTAEVERGCILAIDSYIRQLHKMDQASFAFRYSTTVTGAPSIAKDKLTYINIGVFASCMERMTGYLSGLGEIFSESVQSKCEMEEEACAEYAEYMNSFEPEHLEPEYEDYGE